MAVPMFSFGHHRFRAGWEYVADDPKEGRPSTSLTDNNVEKLQQKLNEKKHAQSLRIIAIALGMRPTVFDTETNDCVKHPPYSLDLASAEYFFISQIEVPVEGPPFELHFQNPRFPQAHPAIIQSCH